MTHAASPLPLLLLLVTTSAAHAQLSSDSDAPIDITGENAEFIDNLSIWTGDVRVVQAESVLTTDRLEAVIAEDGKIEQITAIGDVRYSNGKEAITGERAVYNEAERAITMTGDVIVTQGQQVMSAGSVIYWIDDGKVRFAPEPGRRIRGVFYTNGADEP